LNCPRCRRKLWYWPEFSQPNASEKFLVYECSPCRLVYIFIDFKPTGKLLASLGGVRVIKLKLARRGYTPPPLTQRQPTKAAPSLNHEFSGRVAKKGG
jgi:hypothetical protein